MSRESKSPVPRGPEGPSGSGEPAGASTSKARTAAANRRRVRHGRALRSSVTGPYLAPLDDRIDSFELVITQTFNFARGIWPEELADVEVLVANAPEVAIHGDHIDRWYLADDKKTVVFFRLPIARFDQREPDLIRDRMIIEGYVFRAIAELTGRDPWEIARYRYGR